MDSNIIELVKRGHLLSSEVSDENTEILRSSVAAMLSDLASQLEVQYVRAEESQREFRSADITMQNLEAKCEKLAAENAGLKAGASYFSYGSEHNFEWHKTAEEAAEAAEAAIDDYRGDACDGWSEEVDSVCWGVIMQSSTKVGERPRNEDDRCDPAINTICDYALLPNIETPATDAFLAEMRAQGVEMAMEHMQSSGSLTFGDCYISLNDFAAQLRKGVQS